MGVVLHIITSMNLQCTKPIICKVTGSHLFSTHPTDIPLDIAACWSIQSTSVNHNTRASAPSATPFSYIDRSHNAECVATSVETVLCSSRSSNLCIFITLSFVSIFSV